MNCYCKDGDIATISINNFEESFSIPGPVCVETSFSSKKCWHFWATNDGAVTFEHFACGETAYYQPDPNLKNNGAWLIVDGVTQVGVGSAYYYWSGGPYARHLRQETIPQPIGGYITGSCNDCLSPKWKLIIKDTSGRQYYEKEFTEEPIVRVDCNGCPPEHIRCKCASFPGYCCIPCKEIQNEISAMIGILRRMR